MFLQFPMRDVTLNHAKTFPQNYETLDVSRDYTNIAPQSIKEQECSGEY